MTMTTMGVCVSYEELDGGGRACATLRRVKKRFQVGFVHFFLVVGWVCCRACGGIGACGR